MRKWGQHYLKDQECVKEILCASDLKPDDAVLEIGPGKGALTRQIETHAAKVLAIEIDPVLSAHIQSQSLRGVTVLNKNILSLEEHEIIAVLGSRWKIIGNLPYYITSPILQKIFSWNGWESAVVTVQKEVAERIVSQPGSKAYGLLTILVHIHAISSCCTVIPRDAFIPPPKVDSAVIKLVKRQNTLIPPDEIEKFFSFLKICFHMRRKKLYNSLAKGMNLSKPAVKNMFLALHFNVNVRPEELSLEELKRIYELTESL